MRVWSMFARDGGRLVISRVGIWWWFGNENVVLFDLGTKLFFLLYLVCCTNRIVRPRLSHQSFKTLFELKIVGMGSSLSHFGFCVSSLSRS